jgi:hypothetical protein
MNTSLCVGLSLIGVLWAIPSAASPPESAIHQLSRGIALSIGQRAPLTPQLARADLARQLPGPFRFIAAFVTPAPVPTPGLLAMTDAEQTRQRAATVADADRCRSEGLAAPSLGAIAGVGLAGAAVALHPTLVAPEHGATIQINPRIWPPGINIQGVFF